MDVDDGSGSEKDDEPREDVDEIGRKRAVIQLWIDGTHCQELSREGQSHEQKERWRNSATCTR